ncbi:MAG: glycosyl transferase family 1 [Flavobacteriales bacterium]|nr:MAG: glycosyl transferase family 1 [Flavobacteriales bacterium]
MKITLIGTAYPYRGGLAAFKERLAREFQSNGDEVTIHTFTLQYPSFLFPGKSQYSDGPPPMDLNIIRSINSVNPFNWFSFGAKIAREKPDLVIVDYWLPFMAPCLGTIARQIKKNNHTKIISIVHNIIPHEKRMGDHLFSNYFVKSADGFIALSKTVLSDLNTFDKSKPKVFCPHPIYDNFGPLKSKKTAKAMLSLDDNTNYLLFFGIIRDYKGLDLLLEAFADKRLRDFPLKLIIAGEYYSNEKHYLELIKKHRLQDHIIQKNEFIPDSQVVDYFCAVDMIVQPYKSATQSGVTQIAYHFERPMLVTDVGGLAEIVPHQKCGYVCEVNAQSVADALVDFYQNQRENEFAQNVKEEKKNFSWMSMVEHIYKLNEDLSE